MLCCERIHSCVRNRFLVLSFENSDAFYEIAYGMSEQQLYCSPENKKCTGKVSGYHESSYESSGDH